MSRVPEDNRSEAEQRASDYQHGMLTARKHLATFKDFRGFRPFGCTDSPYAVDRCNSFLSEASCIAALMGAAFEDSASLIGKNFGSEVDAAAGSVVAGALAGIETLIGLAVFFLDDVAPTGDA